MRAADELRINAGLVIPVRDLRFTFARSSGPGGQNVNKVNTKALLRFDLAGSELLDDASKARIAAKAGNKVTAAGEILVSCESHRTAAENRRECLERFADLMRVWLHRPRARKATRPGAAAVRKRLDAKKRRSGNKSLRRQPKGEEE